MRSIFLLILSEIYWIFVKTGEYLFKFLSSFHRESREITEIPEKLSGIADKLIPAYEGSILLAPFRPVVRRYGLLSHYILIPLLTAAYIVLALMSSVPFPFLYSLMEGILLWIIALLIYCFSSKMAEDLSEKLDLRQVNDMEIAYFSLPLLLMGILILIYNYMNIGSLPVLTPELRSHNVVWMIGYDLYLIGVSLFTSSLVSLYLSGRISKSFLYEYAAVAIFFTIVITFPSGFRLDIFTALVPIIVILWFRRVIKARHIVLYLLFPLFLIFVGQKYILMSRAGAQTDIWYILISRAGFTLYSLSLIIKSFGPWGISYGKVLFLNPILTILGVPRLLIGPFLGSVIVGIPSSYTSTFIGPIWADFGIIGVILLPLFFGTITGVYYNLAVRGSSVSLALYSMILSCMLVWIESGPVHPYLYIPFFLTVPIIPLISRRRSVGS
ncbi:MAG: hypothetical protein ACP5KE_01800 [Candidatus Methanodesulfokora sp.]|jgi:hypothetical protein